MKNVNYGKMMFGIIIGTLGTLVLTLNIWGSEWYKIIASLLLGMIIGLFIADYQGTVAILKIAFQESFATKYKSEEEKHLRKLEMIFSLNFLIFLSIFSLSAATIFFVHEIASVYFLTKMVSILTLITGIFLTYLFILIINSCNSANWCEERRGLGMDKLLPIWNKPVNNIARVHYKVIWDYMERKNVGFDNLTRGMSFWTIEKKLILTSYILFKKTLKHDIYGFFNLIILFLLSVFYLIFTTLPMFPFWFFKELSKHGYLLIVSASIVIGGLIGTIFNSYFYGVGSALVFFALINLLHLLAKEVNIFFAFKGKGMEKVLDRVF